MGQASHIAALESKHRALETRITSEEKRPAPDMGLLATLKKEKLRLKEQMRAN